MRVGYHCWRMGGWPVVVPVSRPRHPSCNWQSVECASGTLGGEISRIRIRLLRQQLPGAAAPVLVQAKGEEELHCYPRSRWVVWCMGMNGDVNRNRTSRRRRRRRWRWRRQRDIGGSKCSFRVPDSPGNNSPPLVRIVIAVMIVVAPPSPCAVPPP